VAVVVVQERSAMELLAAPLAVMGVPVHLLVFLEQLLRMLVVVVDILALVQLLQVVPVVAVMEEI
jgi:hypothetical protein